MPGTVPGRTDKRNRWQAGGSRATTGVSGSETLVGYRAA
jgi:hypothetical protein